MRSIAPVVAVEVLSTLAVFSLISCSLAYTYNGCTAYRFQAVDPIVSPGTASAHLHTFFGSNNLNENTTTSSSLFDGCTSCQNSFDKSTYWTPTVFMVYRNGTYRPLTPLFRAYYDTIDQKTTPIPANFRMLAGNSRALNASDPGTVAAAVNWYCSVGPSTRTNETKLLGQFPTINCPGYLAINLFFPTCYKVDNETGDFITAYKNRACPPGYLQIPEVWLSMRYDVRSLVWDDDGTAPLWLASGDSYTFHADFFNGWHDSDSQEMVKHLDPAGEFHIGGSVNQPNSPPCKPTSPYDNPFNYDDFIIGDQKWGKKNPTV